MSVAGGIDWPRIFHLCVSVSCLESDMKRKLICAALFAIGMALPAVPARAALFAEGQAGPATNAATTPGATTQGAVTSLKVTVVEVSGNVQVRGGDEQP